MTQKAKASVPTPVSKPKVVVAQKAPKAVAAAATGSPSKKPGTSKSVPQVVAKAQPKAPIAAPVIKPVAPAPKKSEAKAVVSKPAAKPSPSVPSPGSKATDKVGKPSVSTNTPAVKAVEHKKPEEKINKPIAAPVVKQTEKMSEKKEIRPVGGTTITEEPQKSRYSDKELEEFDQLIDQKLIVAREQLEFYLKQLEDMAENPDNKIKGLDDGLSSLESERVSSMASRQQKLIQHLENAKIRIKNKVYGICRETGKLISKERLRAVPHATLSIEAKQAQN
ncbi:MAG TPA: TraR/DksA C4-type zinc finger protein [Saprospiraceae bacterium]|nr:TraR/DksA C4-type zinc finger protein [Saprospiraceae bacterium]